jgi:hypothetical protein
MAGRTRYVCCHVPLMSEINKVRQIIDFDPGHRLSLFPISNNLLDLRVVFSNIFMTSHAELHGWYSRNNGAARINMAVKTVDLVIARMKLVTEVERLYRRGFARVEAKKGND